MVCNSVTTTPPLTGRSGATATTTIAAGRTVAAATRTPCGRRRAVTASACSAGVSTVRPDAMPATPCRLAVSLAAHRAQLHSPAAAGAQGHTLKTIRFPRILSHLTLEGKLYYTPLQAEQAVTPEVHQAQVLQTVVTEVHHTLKSIVQIMSLNGVLEPREDMRAKVQAHQTMVMAELKEQLPHVSCMKTEAGEVLIVRV